jgi:hypothetical protein
MRELRGYSNDDELPDYRKPSAAILIDGQTFNAIIRGRQISPRMLPDFVQEKVSEQVPLYHSIGEIESLLKQAQKSDKACVSLSLPSSQDILAFMNHANDEPYQEITRLYWSLSAPALEGVVDHVRTTLVELVAEMRAGTPDAVDTPSADVADHAVNLAVYGRGNRINVTSAQASGAGAHRVSVAPARAKRSRWRTIGAAAVGLATIAGVLVAIAAWQGWGV